jgi:pSer/pThr/pTyr-binding forkhead associated (FHA) protein
MASSDNLGTYLSSSRSSAFQTKLIFLPPVAMIGLHFKFQPPDTLYTERRIRLDKDQKTVRIGRTSKRDPNLSPKMNNGWIDSPVISREHAEFSLGDENQVRQPLMPLPNLLTDPSRQAVYIKDLNSRHGTFLNHERLEPNRAYPVAPGDVVKFGTDIQRDDLTHPPPSAQVFIATSQAGPPKVEPAQRRVFVVPDDSDSSDAEFEDNGVMEVRHAVKNLREVAGVRHPRLDSEVSQVLSQPAQAQDGPAPAPAVVVDITDDRDTASAPAPWIVDLTEASDMFDGVAAGEVAEQANMKTAPANNTQTGTSEVMEELEPEMPQISEEQYQPRPRDRELDMIDLDAETDSDDDECPPDFDTPVDDLMSEEDPISFDDDESDNLDSDDSDEDEGQSEDMVLWDESEPSSPIPTFFPRDSDDAHHHAAKADLEAVEEYKESQPTYDPYSGVHESVFDSESDSDSDMDAEVVETEEITTEAAMAPDLHQLGSHDTEELPTMIAQAVTTESARDWPTSSDSMPFTSSQPAALPQASSTVLPGVRFLDTPIYAPEPDYRLRLPSILNDPPQQAPARVDVSMNTRIGPAPGRTQPAERTDESFSALAMDAPMAQDPATTGEDPLIVQLVPQSPLIESGDRFLAYPLEETSQIKDRSSPELDMSSAWLFQQSKVNNTAKASNSQPVDKVLRAGDLGSTKRKAADISDVTESEEAQQVAALAAAITVPKAQVDYKPNVDSLAGFSAKYNEDRAPKKVRRMAEAARLFALGGAAAGVALFTTLVATAPSLT